MQQISMMHLSTKIISDEKLLKIREIVFLSFFIGLFFVMGGSAFTYLPYSFTLKDVSVAPDELLAYRCVRIKGEDSVSRLHRLPALSKEKMTHN